ncbi:MAG: Na/Pi cotransporter family protein [Firmicutes bacterium]|mgnify:CR=1 FL=1|jgi:phosphate:Na+ symporter|nr:Na/Pi cotransporter family protein [Bacillota bacterium]
MREIIFGVAGGLALFIYGMNLMGEGLKKTAGDRMRSILASVTRNPLMAVGVGALVTAIIQSSSATTVMTIGFVNARLMTLTQAIGIIIGANIGTTITAQLIAFKIGDIAYPIAAIGFILFFFGRRKQLKYLGQVVFGFGVLFIGLNTMSQVLKPLADNPIFIQWMTQLGENRLLGVLIGTVMTMVVQSSSATIGVLQSLASQPVVDGETVRALIPLTTAVPILLGDNIGTTITAILASIGSNRTAKRAALSHSLFNIFGTLVCLLVFPLFIAFVYQISPRPQPALGITEVHVIKRQIANAHTFFNVLNALLWLPFTRVLAAIVTKLIPGEDKYLERGVKYLDDHVLGNAEMALDLAGKEIGRMGEIAWEIYQEAEQMFNGTNQLQAKMGAVQEGEEILDELQDAIIHYLSMIVSRNSLTDRQSDLLADLIHVTSDIERIGDHCINIAEEALYLKEEGVAFSPQAKEELGNVFRHTSEMLFNSLQALLKRDYKAAKRVLELEADMDKLEEQCRTNHMERLNDGTCNPKSAVGFTELMKNLERIADHCNNIAEAVLNSRHH